MCADQHFAYADEDSFKKDQLLQGDLLERTADLESVLQKLYPYAYDNPDKYPYFVVLTHSCDLVRRGDDPPKAEQITLAAARSIQYLLEHEIADLQTPQLKAACVCLRERKQGLFQKVERLISNEEAPYFYLHPLGTPFGEPLVAFLRITFPLRADAHYDTCLHAKRVQLCGEFQAKLGWLTTLVFGRVATEDFDPNERHGLAKDYIDGVPDIIWVKRSVIENEARKVSEAKHLKDLTPAQVKTLVEELAKTDRSEIVVGRILEIAGRALGNATEKDLRELRRALLDDANFNAAIRD